MMGHEQPLRRTEELDRRHKRTMRWSLLASLLLHLLLLLIFGLNRSPIAPGAAAGPRSGDDRAASAGGLRAVVLRPEQQIVIRPPDPVEVPDVIVDVVEEPPPEIELAGTGLDGLAGVEQGQFEGPGLADGTGQGDGGTEDTGRFRQLPPSPRSLMTAPMGRPSSVRGREVQVAVFVDESGRVVPDSTRLHPTSGNTAYDDELRRRAAQWLFDPARRGGQPVAAWFEYTLTF